METKGINEGNMKNNKTLLIVGDSYCASKDEKSWCKILGKKLNCETTVVGEISASLFYAYQGLTKSSENFDYYLVLVTNPGRLFFKSTPFFSNPFAANWAKNTNDINLHNKAKASEFYYNYLVNEDFDNFVHDSLITQIKEFLKYKNHVIYPNFKTSRIDINYFSMLDITNECFSKLFNKNNFNFYKDVYQNYKETNNVINHTTVESQEIIADHFFQLLTDNKSNIKISDFSECAPLKLEDYFEKRSH